jgi:hypothetical protein
LNCVESEENEESDGNGKDRVEECRRGLKVKRMEKGRRRREKES